MLSGNGRRAGLSPVGAQVPSPARLLAAWFEGVAGTSGVLISSRGKAYSTGSRECPTELAGHPPSRAAVSPVVDKSCL